MKSPKQTVYELGSSFSVSGRLKVQINEFHNHLESAPFFRLKTKEPKTFSVAEADGTVTSELQTVGNKLVFNYAFHRRSTKEYVKNLLKFLSLLAYVGNVYETDFSSLYPTLVEVLNSYLDETSYKDGKIENSELLIRQAKTIAAMNCTLSLKILDFERKCRKVETENESLARFSKDAINGAMGRLSANDSNDEALPRIIGTTMETYRAARSLVFEKGYKNEPKQ